MPNWCANRLRVTGSAGDIEKVRALMVGAGVPAYVRAESEGIQLFLAGCAALLQPATDDVYAPFPALTMAGKGESSTQNMAFTAWLWHLRDGAELSDEVCDQLHSLWLSTGVQVMTWDTLSEHAQQVISGLFQQKIFDWSGHAYPGAEKMWNALCGMEGMKASADPFDMRLLLPPRLDVAINGFNGGLLNGVPRGYEFCVDTYGVKWPVGCDLNVNDSGPEWLEVDFDTPWSPPSDSVLAALSRRFNVGVEHWYAESGESFCGYNTYSDGGLTSSISSDLMWEEEREDGYSNIAGPEWILDNVAHYGG